MGRSQTRGLGGERQEEADLALGGRPIHLHGAKYRRASPNQRLDPNGPANQMLDFRGQGLNRRVHEPEPPSQAKVVVADVPPLGMAMALRVPLPTAIRVA